MLFHSSIRKELGRGFGATLVVLITIVMTMMLIRTLGQASRGSVDPSDVMLVMAYTVLGQLPIILTLSLFVSIVATLSRMYRDSEMAVWLASGQGLLKFLEPLLRFATPILIAIAVTSLVSWPWANQQTRDMRDRYEKRGDLERVTPGQFQESSNGNRVFFIDKATPDSKTGTNVFISSTEKGKQSVTSAQSGQVEIVGDSRVLMLQNGQRLENAVGRPELKISQFEQYGTQIGTSVLDAVNEIVPRARSTLNLIYEPTPSNRGELAWRLGLTLAAINLVVLAMAVASVNPRVGTSANLVFALFAFVVYYNLLNMSQSWIANGRATFGGMLLALHGGMFAVGMLWVLKQHNNWSLRSVLRGKRIR